MFINFFVISTFVGRIFCKTSNPVVQTPLGRIQGYNKQSFNERIFSAFEGIPYAQPPVGNLRFKDPVPIEPWSDSLKATSSAECTQIRMTVASHITGDEDCLFLNVYVPKETPNPAERLDVIVHIHGGAFLRGSGHFYSHPEFLMDHDVIFVTMNYRLGIFGFLSTEDDVIAGNFGLKDQMLALKWIQKNIASFGGNPNSVTLTGLSAGAASVHYHYLSPLSRGLFHRGFSQSGTVLNPWALQEKPLERAVYLAKYLGCPVQNTQEILICLRQIPAKQLVNATKLFYRYANIPPCPFAPVIENNSNPFIDKHPYEMLIKGDFQDLPWITSVASKEGTYFQPDQLKEIGEQFTDLAPYLLDCNFTLSKTILKTTTEKIKRQYSNDNREINLVDLITDRWFVVDVERAAKIQAKLSKSPVYFLYFNYALENSQLEGTTHGGDAKFLFYNVFGNARKMTVNDYKVKDIMVNMLVSYAKNSNPEIPDVDWLPTQHQEITYLNLTDYKLDGIKVQTNRSISPVTFWDSLGILENDKIIKLETNPLAVH